MTLHFDPLADPSPTVTEARIAATLERLSHLEQACAEIEDGGWGLFYLVCGVPLAVWAGWAVLLALGVL